MKKIEVYIRKGNLHRLISGLLLLSISSSVEDKKLKHVLGSIGFGIAVVNLIIIILLAANLMPKRCIDLLDLN